MSGCGLLAHTEQSLFTLYTITHLGNSFGLLSTTCLLGVVLNRVIDLKPFVSTVSLVYIIKHTAVSILYLYIII